MKKHLASITILITDRQSNVAALNELLTNNGHLIMARLGVNPQRMCTEKCTGFIILAVEGERKAITKLTNDIDKLYGIKAMSSVITA